MPRKTRKKNILVFVATLLIATGIFAWFYPLNKGVIEITANITPYSAYIDDILTDCPQNPCLIKLKTGLHNIKIEKEGYFPDASNLNIQRGQATKYLVEFKKIPSLNSSSNIPVIEAKTQKNIPEIIANLPILAPSWNKNETILAFVDKNEEKIKILNADANLKIIASLKNISEDFKLSWSPNDLFLLGYEGSSLYFIDINKAARTKNVLGFSPKNITWMIDGQSLLINDDQNDLYKVDFLNKTIKPLAITFDLKNAVWDINNMLISYSYNTGENKSDIESFDPKTEEKKVIITKYNFPLSKIILDASLKIYFFNSESQTWYELDY